MTKQYNRIALLTHWVRNLRQGIYKKPMPQKLWRYLSSADADTITVQSEYNEQLGHYLAIIIPQDTEPDIFILPHQPQFLQYEDFKDYLWQNTVYPTPPALQITTHARRVNTLNFMGRFVRRDSFYDILPRKIFLDMAIRSKDYLYLSRQPGSNNDIIYNVIVPLNKNGCHAIRYTFTTPHTQYPHDMRCFYEFLDNEFDNYDNKTGLSIYGD